MRATTSLLPCVLQIRAADLTSLRPSSKTFSSSCQAGEPGLSQLRASNEHLLPALTTSTFTQVDQRVPALAVASSFLHSLLQGWPGCPLLRASSDHSLIVGALRAQRAVWPPLVLPLPRPRAAGAREFPGRPVPSRLSMHGLQTQGLAQPPQPFLPNMTEDFAAQTRMP